MNVDMQCLKYTWINNKIEQEKSQFPVFILENNSVLIHFHSEYVK